MAIRMAGIRITLFLVTICVFAHVLVSAEDAKKKPKISLQQTQPKEKGKSQHIQHIPSQKEAKQQKQSLPLNQTTTQESKHAEETQNTQPRKTRSGKLIQVPETPTLECESEGFIPDSYNCSIFHLCVKKQEIPLDIQNLSAAYFKISFQCNTGFLYDSKSQECLNISDCSRAIECSNPSSFYVENNFTFRRNNTNEVSTQSSSGHPEVKYVTDENDDKEGGNGQNYVTTSNEPPSINPRLSNEYLDPSVIVPVGRNPLVYVVPRKKATNDSNHEPEQRQKSGKSADSENERQQSPYNGNGGSEKATVIYIIPSFNALQNSNLLPPQSSTTSPNPQSLAAGRQSHGNVSPLSNHPTEKIGGIVDEENGQPEVHLPEPSDDVQDYLPPSWPEMPADITENVGSTEFNQIWQTNKNKSKTKSTSQPPKKPSIHLLPPWPQSPEDILDINKVENNDDIGIKNETFRLATSTTPKNVRNMSCRAYSSTAKHPFATFYCTIDELTNHSTEVRTSFNSTSKLGQQLPSYNPRPGSTSVIPQQSVKSIPERSDTETTPRPPDPVPKFSYPRPHERNDRILNTSPPTSPSVLPQQSVKSIPERSDTETYPRRPDPSPKFSYPRPHEGNDNKPNTSPPTRTQFVRNVQTSTSTSLYRSSSSKEPPRKQQETKKGNKIICTQEGFFAIENDCEHFYRCTSVGDSFRKYTFSCGPGTVWDQSNNACNHRWATSRQDC